MRQEHDEIHLDFGDPRVGEVFREWWTAELKKSGHGWFKDQGT
jgi:hypothetical protein